MIQMVIESLPAFIRENYEVHEWKHATAIMREDFPNELNDIITVLTSFRLKYSEVIAPGGRKSSISSALDSALFALGWKTHRFHTHVTIDEEKTENPTHEIDCYKNHVALEVEWNNKDPFYDRDLNNFRVLFDLRAISVGVIITRCDELQEIFDAIGKGKSYGQSTTHMRHLLSKVRGNGSGGCPVLIFGISKKLYVKK
jgi:hypothetical protein